MGPHRWDPGKLGSPHSVRAGFRLVVALPCLAPEEGRNGGQEEPGNPAFLRSCFCPTHPPTHPATQPPSHPATHPATSYSLAKEENQT